MKYPNVQVQLTGNNGNAFNILGAVTGAMRESGEVPEAEILEFFKEATDGDYDHLLRTCMEWVDVQ
jgi:hypothetical protein